MEDPSKNVQLRVEHTLMRAADETLFREFFRGHHAYVWHSLRRLGIPERDLEDVTHDVFAVVHRKLAAYDRARPPRPWLFAIAARVASDYRRLSRNRREHIDGTVETAADPAESAERRLERLDAQRLVIAALQRVDESRRDVFVLIDIDGLPVTEAAHALEIPLNTAYSRLRLARQEFAAAVARVRSRGAS
jgi:RNA polymerase sigma-70 factor (ECF subfamily)